MTPPAGYSEDELIERPAIALFQELRWEARNCFHEWDSGTSVLGRQTMAEVVLVPRLRAALQRLNPTLPTSAIEQAIEELKRDRSLVSPAQANREVATLVRDGIKVATPEQDGGERVELVRVMDWDNPDNNHFFLASQFWIQGELYKRRADLVGFVNGVPLVFIELKASHKNLRSAYDRNLTDYRTAIPQVFWYNALVILSNGSESKVGSVTAGWEHFADWKRINSEGEQGVVSLETMIHGTCERGRLLEIAENFCLFQESKGGLIKLIAKNHQYLGVNNSIRALEELKKRKGKLGVFWHTQGSGKSVSMIFFSRKVLRKRPGNWTFLVVCDRDELDDQIYKEFKNSGAITEGHCQAENMRHLRQLLTEDHRYVFTLIQKFGTRKGEKHPILSERSDIIVMTDEAHRSQYDTLALNMRTALPEASFIAFTGTPLMAGEERTKQVFGDYVSIYNFRQSVEDAATVPLFYENRIPELQLTNQNLNEDIYQVIEDAELDEEQEKKLEREFAREYHLITREDRLETIAADIVEHFMGRGFPGKAMAVSIDKATAVKMYDKVQRHWKERLKALRARLQSAKTQEEHEALSEEIRFMEETDMAVVVSQSQNEIAEMKKKGVDITPHRKRMVKEKLDEKFKDPKDPFRIVFVCAMWMTGFDVPSCSTIYLDKPMRNHTLMQTIARANRVFPQKENGLIVDYVGVFRNLQKALSIYGSGSGGGVRPGESPVQPKSELVEQLRTALAESTQFCERLGVKPDGIRSASGFQRVRLIDDARDAILVSDDIKQHFLLLAGTVVRLYKAILPDPSANELLLQVAVFDVIAQKIRSLTPPANISGVMQDIEEVLDRSIATEGYVIHERPLGEPHVVDLSKIDFEALEKQFSRGHRRTETERLRGAVGSKLQGMVQLNRTRVDYLQKFQRLIEEYNAGSINVETFFKQLMKLAKELNEEEKRAVTEDLTEEELAVFDLLTKPEMELTAKDRKRVKAIARELLGMLKTKRLVLDWRKRQQSRAAVRLAIEEALEGLPVAYTPALYRRKCETVYGHVFESYAGAGKSIYENVA
jgi:type I restriction enzyme R subunit